jgi:hypothetical protein
LVVFLVRVLGFLDAFLKLVEIAILCFLAPAHLVNGMDCFSDYRLRGNRFNTTAGIFLFMH